MFKRLLGAISNGFSAFPGSSSVTRASSGVDWNAVKMQKGGTYLDPSTKKFTSVSKAHEEALNINKWRPSIGPSGVYKDPYSGKFTSINKQHEQAIAHNNALNTNKTWGDRFSSILKDPALGKTMISGAWTGAAGGIAGSLGGLGAHIVSPENFSQDRSTFSNAFRGAVMGAGLGAVGIGAKRVSGTFGGKFGNEFNKTAKFTHNVAQSGVAKGALFAAGVYGGVNMHLTRPANPIK